VLVVDDDKDILFVLRESLRDRFEVLTASDGMRAVALAVALKPDLFVIDWMLPKASGIQLVQLLRANAEFKNAPIVFISAKSSSQGRALLKTLRISSFLPKPFLPNDLIRALETEMRKPSFRIRTDRPVAGGEVLGLDGGHVPKAWQG
jgi:DNA-binding response OmpR family regulator